MLRVELDEPRLVRAWSMEYQMFEAHFHVRTNAFDLLFRVVRDDPTAGCTLGW